MQSKQFIVLKEFCMEFMGLDEEDYDSLVFEILINGAKGYLKNAGVPKANQNKALYKLAVALLVSHWWDNGQVVTDVNNQPLKYSLSYIISQLKYC